MAEYFGGTRGGRRRDAVIAGGVLLLALLLFFLPAAFQRPIRAAVRSTVLRPFLAGQATLVERREESVDVSVLSAQRDSLAALVAAQASLAEENRRLRALLGLRERAGAKFLPAEVLRPGVQGAESTFFLALGSADGVQVGSPVIAAAGLVGVVRDVGTHTSQAIDWTHPDFRASAMTADGAAYGIVEPRRGGAFREFDMLSLTGAPFHTDIAPGTRVVTSGRGGIFPRGIPIGTVVGIEEADTGWRKSYLLKPAVRPAEASHVLVGVQTAEQGADLSALWHVTAPPDTAGLARPDGAGGAPRAPAPGGQARPDTGTTRTP
ncbi:MAG: rod shape-determining protein MreC [Gemmatimonadetes bacterium]|nr:rod shape-determining protein MreC [Gemmatimonadota bacterium]